MSGPADPRQRWAESFGSDAGRYDRARPRYPQQMVERIVAGSPGTEFLDVGCGTGIAARQFEAAGCHLLGVEVDARMADEARQFGLDVEVAPFEEWDRAGRTFDAVVAGQAWHWIDAVAGASRAAQALRPGGRLAVFWNVFQPPPEVAARFSAVNQRVLSGPLASAWSRPPLEAYAPLFAKATDGIRQTDGYGDVEEWRYEWDWPYTRDTWLDQVPTFGGHSQLAPEQLEELLRGLGQAVDAVGGSFTMAYTTVVVTAVRAAQG
jgi:SAM-dependent methyltransferase